MSIVDNYQNLKNLHFDTYPNTILGMLKFGERLRQHRDGKGLTLYRVSKLIDVPQSNLTSIEKGRRPASEEILHKLAAIPELDITLDQLKAWQLMDEYSDTPILIAAKEIGAKSPGPAIDKINKRLELMEKKD